MASVGAKVMVLAGRMSVRRHGESATRGDTRTGASARCRRTSGLDQVGRVPAGGGVGGVGAP